VKNFFANTYNFLSKELQKNKDHVSAEIFEPHGFLFYIKNVMYFRTLCSIIEQFHK